MALSSRAARRWQRKLVTGAWLIYYKLILDTRCDVDGTPSAHRNVDSSGEHLQEARIRVTYLVVSPSCSGTHGVQ